LLLSELCAPIPYQKHSPGPKFKVSDRSIEQFRNKRKTAVSQVADTGKRRIEIDDIERFFLKDAQIKIISRRRKGAKFR
jgi:hypothetical protein